MWNGHRVTNNLTFDEHEIYICSLIWENQKPKD